MMALARCVDPQTEKTLREFAVPAEYLPRHINQASGVRYFRSPNIVPIEHYRLSGRAPAPIVQGKVLPFRR
jgi:hypothetical protein